MVLQHNVQHPIPDALLKIKQADAVSVIVDVEIDARGLNCPMPLLKAKQGLRNLQSGQVLRLLATDSGSLKDILAFSQLTPHRLVAFAVANDAFCYLIAKG